MQPGTWRLRKDSVPKALASGLALLIVLAAPDPAKGQERAETELRPARAASAPRIDGILDDGVWSGEPQPLGNWVSYNPLRGEQAEEKTLVWIAYDDEALYFAFRCLDSQPNRIRTTIARRDNTPNDDWVGLSLDSSRAGQLAYHLFVNPSGIQSDALQSGTTGEDNSPDFIWQSASRIDGGGWSAEMRIPMETIRFRSGPDVRMGILFWRKLSRSGVSTAWPEIRPGQWVFESNATMVFDNLQARRLLDVIPSLTLSGAQGRQNRSRWNPVTGDADVGASIKYGVTSAITLDATVNPDFSQVESDAFEVEVNQRFPVFFSEKRPFFMEGMGLFNLAGTGGDATMRTAVHTRTIIDPSAGLKLTGSSGQHTFGLLSSTDVAVEEGGRRYVTVGREVMNFGQGQYVGLLVTDSEYGTDYNRVIGGDAAVKRGRFLANSSFLSTHSQSPTGVRSQGIGAQGKYSYSTLRYSFSGQLEHYDRGFRMDTAFINRVGLTRFWEYQDLSFYPSHPKFRWIKRVNPFFWMTGVEDRAQGGTEAFYLPVLRLDFTRAGSLRLEYGRGHETYAGQEFTTGRVRVQGGAQILRWLNIRGSAQRGPAIYYDEEAPFQGYRRGADITVGLQPNSRFNNNTSYNFVRFNNEATGLHVYSVHIVNMRNTYQFTPRFFVRAVTQFDSSRRRLLGDFLASYELSPGTVVHAGYGALFGRELDDLSFERYTGTARALFFKASYRASF
jgi:hypothetical protein